MLALQPLAEFLAEYRPYFDSEGVRQWTRRGHTAGLHSRHHPYCSELTRDEIVQEIIAPAEDLRRRFDLERVWFSYPFGRRLPETLERELYDEGVIDCALGIAGSARLGPPPYRLERASIEQGRAYSIFGRVLLGR